MIELSNAALVIGVSLTFVTSYFHFLTISNACLLESVIDNFGSTPCSFTF